MPCFAPIKAWRKPPSGLGRVVRDRKGDLSLSKNSKISFSVPVFRKLRGYDEIFIPCGRCPGCLYERTRAWSIRCMHESQLHRDNSFVTITYDDVHLPSNGSLVFRHLQLFFKRLRKSGARFRYFACGEYGDKLARPHYHICFFGFSFPDRVYWSHRKGSDVFRSKLLERCWRYGLSEVADFSPACAAYVAGYCQKKLLGSFRLMKEVHYGKRIPEFTTMSRRPGIGREWLRKFQSDIYPHDKVVVGNTLQNPPRFYDSILPAKLLSDIKAARIADPVTGEIRPQLSKAELDKMAEAFRLKSNSRRRNYEATGIQSVG